MGLVSQKINKSSGAIELLLQPKSRKIQKKEKKRKKIQPAKLKTRKGSLGKNKGIKKEKIINKRFWLYT